MTMHELAVLAGISRTSVSLILNGKADGKIAAEKQRFVRELAERHNYRPNAAAKSLRSRKQYVIGIVMPTPRNLFYADMVSLLQIELAQQGYMALFSFWSDWETMRKAFDAVIRHNVDGIISWDEHPVLKEIRLPSVIYDRKSTLYDSVSLDFHDASRQAVDYLQGLGHSRIGYAGPLADQRAVSLRKELSIRGLPVCDPWFCAETGTFDGGVAVWDKLSRMREYPSAMFLHDDTMAIGMISALAKKGLSVPRDLSLIGFDNSAETPYLLPPLTSFDPGREVICASLIELMLKRLEQPDAPRRHVDIKPKLIVRNSCTEWK